MSSWSDLSTPQVQPFEYADAAVALSDTQCSSDGPAAVSCVPPDLSKIEKDAYERGKSDGVAEVQARFDDELRTAQQQIKTAIEHFSDERRRYFESVESEVVQLSLAIARRVIEHEATVDDCLLGGMVRVALERIESKTHVRVRVRPELLETWHGKLEWTRRNMVELVPDPAIDGDMCRLETELGSTEIGIEPKLKEIEQSFFDLLAQRPEAKTSMVMQ